ncbi:MAG: tetratricopeptide repeat protein [Sphingobacteriaceae bacterium]|nr:tetratricopeptide repeat protein [Sphingobacteriaceae bacterium]
MRLGLVEREKGVYNKSSEYYYKALEIAEQNDFKKQRASIYNGIAILAAIQKDPEKSH